MTRKPAPFPRDRFEKFCSQLNIISKDSGLSRFKPNRAQLYIQEEIIKAIDEGKTSIVILKPRQIGASTWMVALDLFWAWEHPGLCGAFAVHTDKARERFRNIITTFQNNLPATHKVRTIKENREMMIIDGGSTFDYLVAGVKEKTVGGLGRSGGYNFSHCTEVAYWGTPGEIDELRATFSERYPYRLYIWESTANGFNHFADMWDEAKESPVQAAIFVGWWRCDFYQYERDDPLFQFYCPGGDDERWSKEERRRAGLVKRLYDWDITVEQLAWYRWALSEKCSNDQSSMDEKYPWTEEDAFVASGSKFFSAGPLTDATRRARGIPFWPFRYSLGREWQSTEVTPGTAKQHDLKVWEEPVANACYVIGCDPAYGSSDEADRCAISVWRCFADRVGQCAEYVSATTSTHECAWVLAHLCGYYGAVMPIIEISGPGMQVFKELQRLQVETLNAPLGEMRETLRKIRHFFYRRGDSVNAGGLSYNWRMTRDTKWTCMSALRDALETKEAVANSVPLLEEMRTVSIKDGIIEASGRGKDDRVVAAGLAIHAWKTWERTRLIAMGMTFDRAFKPEPLTANQAQKNVADYLKTLRIATK